ncbi:hypothetical protein HMN09_00939100 [Mycena chlorophos]|uniref:Uncharacterized protein n=1 Tax=Mycena chlorophos TaxID=658473 RepID=A0A8H6W3N6_MYCCL|nr:hypothetical protein HMN09_00939100 [Mycena chlorophos]
MSQPRLPPELEREIFETAAILHPGTIPALVATARRVQEWTEPMLFRVLRFKLGTPQTEAFLHALRTKPPDFAARSVRHIFFEALDRSVPLAVGLEILQKCPGIVDFGTTKAFTGRAVLDALRGLPNLRVLTLGLSSLDSETDESLASALERVTHLTVLDRDYPSIVKLLPRLPRLTHFAMKHSTDHGGSPLPLPDPNIFADILSSCPHLHVLLITSAKSPFPVIYPHGPPTSDPRLVFAFRDVGYVGFWSGWLAIAYGQDEDIWVLAEGIVKARVSGDKPWQPIASEWLGRPEASPQPGFYRPNLHELH